VRIDPTLSEWLNLFARWFHVFAGILWIGTTYYFTWLDAQLSEAERAAEGGEEAQVWMVHSGGFYVVEKRKMPGTRPLHWFRWEAALTWLSGMFLLALVYYLGGALIDPDVYDISNTAAVLLSLGTLAAAWLVYDLLAQTPLGRNDLVFGAVGFALTVGATYGLTRVFSGRAAFIHVGAIYGTIMAANVWMRILPAQRRTIAAAKSGATFDPALGARAKQRSKHNTFMVVPVVFTMISNHFPVATYGSRHNWLIMSGLVLVGWVAAKFIRRA
jgi:uncharacterized membrane protein